MRNDLTKTMDITKFDLCDVANPQYVTLFASTNGTCSYIYASSCLGGRSEINYPEVSSQYPELCPRHTELILVTLNSAPGTLNSVHDTENSILATQKSALKGQNFILATQNSIRRGLVPLGV